MNRTKAFSLMSEAAPIAEDLVRVLTQKEVDISVWATAMCIALLSIELNGNRVDDNFIIGMIKGIYKIQHDAEKLDDVDNKPNN